MTLNVGLCITSMLCTEKLMSYPWPDDTLIHRMKQNVKSNDLLMSCELNRCSTYLAIADQADTSLGLCIRYATNFQPLIRIYIYNDKQSREIHRPICISRHYLSNSLSVQHCFINCFITSSRPAHLNNQVLQSIPHYTRPRKSEPKALGECARMTSLQDFKSAIVIAHNNRHNFQIKSIFV